jgi:transcriptional regulator with XRE-family HTH domain
VEDGSERDDAEEVDVAGIPVRHLGDYIREQRSSSQISLRQLATLAGVSNPYLSQIERGLRKPSAEILQQIAKGLRISAEALYVQAGILDQRESSGVVDALLADELLNERQKQVLLEIYDSFRKENAALDLSDDAASTLADAQPGRRSRPEASASPAATSGRPKKAPAAAGPVSNGSTTSTTEGVRRPAAAPRKRAKRTPPAAEA